MKLVLSILILALFFYSSSDSYADPILTSLFNKTSSSEDVTKTGLESGRYKSQKTTPIQPAKLVSKHIIVKKKKKNYGKSPASDSSATPLPICLPSQLPIEAQEQDVIYQEPAIQDQFRDLFRSGENNILGKYREQLHSDDVRNNRLEIEIGTGTVYDSSVSNLSYRNYYTLAPTLRAGAHIWMTPLVGISGVYESTFGESISARAGGSDFTAKSTWTEVSLDARKFFGASRKANSIQYGLILNQYKFDVQSSANSRIGLASSGLGIYLKSRIPVAPSYAWLFGFEVFPMLSHAEQQTGLGLTSGASNTSSRIGISGGGEFKFNRSSQVIWTLGVKMETNQFSGAASIADPATGTTPTGVGITNTWTYLNLGYRWGQ